MGDVIAFPVNESRGRAIWRNPFSFVDTDDLLGDKYGAFVFFLDLLVNRPTEFSALIRMFAAAFRNVDESKLNLTQRQGKAVALAFEAVSNGVQPTRYVAENLQIGERAARGLLRRAGDRAKMFRFADLVHISNDYNHLQPSRVEIKAWMMAHKRECAGSGRPSIKVRGAVVNACQGHTLRNHALCWDCMQVYGKTFGDWPDWVGYKVRDIERVHRQNAIEALYRQQKLSVAVDDDYFEVAIAA